MNFSELFSLADEYRELSKGVVNYDKLARYVSTFHSTGIEGSTLTEKEVIDLLSLNKTNKKPFEHHLMVSDHFKALNFTLLKAQAKEKLSLSGIQEINALVNANTGSTVQTMNGIYDISKGEFRLASVFAGSRLFPDAKKVKSLLTNVLEQLELEMKETLTLDAALKLSFWLHFEFVSIHPFGDGNGRTARLLMNYVQEYYKIPLSIVFKQDRIKYIDAIEKARKTDDIEPFYNFMFKQYKKYLKQEIKLLSGN